MSVMRWLTAAMLAWCLSSPNAVHAQAQQSPTAVVPAASENARTVLARVQPAVIQVKGFFGANSAQAFHGTGFAVRAGGIFVTNYHVVAERVQYPDKYRLEYRTPDGATGPIEVLAVDVRHDLAIIRAKGFAPQPLVFDRTPPPKGARAYAVGYPLDVGLTITEGVSNGQVEDSFEPRIHYSGAINAGMSGGPAMNASGEVIGANVSAYLFQQLVSFLVPVAHIADLAAHVTDAVPETSALQQSVVTQMRAHSSDLLDALKPPFVTQVSAGYALPGKIAPFVNCNAAGAPVSEDPVQMVRISCSAKAGIYVQQGLSSGDIKFEHYVLSTDKLDAWRFGGRLSALSQASGAFGQRRHVAPFACEHRVLALKGFDADLMTCTRGYRKLDGLYDFVIRISSLSGGAGRGFASHLDMYGLEFDAGMAFVRRYLEAMAYLPSEAKR